MQIYIVSQFGNNSYTQVFYYLALDLDAVEAFLISNRRNASR